ncbi:MAG: RNA polymerase factor sigma-54 [Fibrobacteraceae bacterium]|nr:RNA polymerase factor sigma-54 [Fibrobacteraceae bacterium]
MDFGLQLGQNQRLEQSLAPQLLQSIGILQKNSLELETAIKEEVESNPLLELSDDPDDFIESAEPPESIAKAEELERRELNPDDIERGTLDESASIDTGLLDGVSNADIDWDRYLEDGYDHTDAPFKDLNAARDENEEWDRPIKDMDASLQDKLKNQLRDWNGTHEMLDQLLKAGCSESHFRDLVEYLINSVDENGFLQGVPEASLDMSSAEDWNNMELSSRLASSSDAFINEIENVLKDKLELEGASLPVREAFHVLQNFTPRGIGARDLRECFLIQAYAIPGFSPLTIKILENHFEDLQALRYGKIAKDLEVTSENIQQAVASLAVLTPHPGRQISSSPIQSIVPDMKVVEKKGHFEVVAFKTPSQKRLRINATYKALLEDPSVSKKDKEYVRERLSKATDFMRAVDNRYTTMEKVMQCIVKRQKDFFTMGPAHLKPMVLQEIAEDVGRDPSTVNRVTNGKYVETPFGVYELKEFFTSGVKQGSSSDADVVGSAQILDAIKSLVDAENKKKPLSDQAIADKLQEQGIKVARRTVAKYREEELKILPARLRKIV